MNYNLNQSLKSSHGNLNFRSLRTKIPLLLAIIAIPLVILLTVVPIFIYTQANRLNEQLTIDENILLTSHSATSNAQKIYTKIFDTFLQKNPDFPTINRQVKKLITNFNMYIDLLSWGASSTTFKIASEGKSYKQWKSLTPNNQLNIGIPSIELEESSALANIYFNAFVKHIQSALTLFEDIHNLLKKGNIQLANKRQLSEKKIMFKATENYNHLTLELDNIFRAAHTKSNQTRLQVANAQRNIIIIIISSVTLLMLLILLSIWQIIGLRLVKPLLNLNDKIKQLGHGQFNILLPVETSDEIGLVAQQFNRLLSDLDKITVSRNYLDSIIKSMSNMLIVTDNNGVIEFINLPLLHTLKFETKDLLRKSVNILFKPNTDEYSKSLLPELDKLIQNGYFFNVEMSLYTSDHQTLPVWLSGSTMYNKAGKIEKIIIAAQDITTLKKAQKTETQLQEIHHRVKNNMEIISSFIHLQSRRFTGKYKAAFEDCQNRILAMRMAHEKLYGTSKFFEINLKDYLEDLIETLAKIYTITDTIKIQLNIAKTVVNIDQAIPIGLIINELITNVFQHAFPKSQKNATMTISLKNTHDNYYELFAIDNGIGLPKDFDLLKTNSLGMILVSTLAENLGGQCEFKAEKGTQIKVTFMLEHNSKV